MELATGTPSDMSAGSVPRVPACDPCRERKTKCNRAIPCSSCLTAKIPCHVSRTRPEKRQRILISSKYDEALGNVDSRLQQVLEAVTTLQGSLTMPHQSDAPIFQGTLQRSSDFPIGFPHIGRNGPETTYRGASSFETHARRVEVSLGPYDSQLPLTEPGDGLSPVLDFRQILNWTSGTTAPPGINTTTPMPLLQEYPHLVGRTMPSSDTVLRLLRLTQTEKQRFFVDVDLFDEQHFTQLCSEVFFAINPYSLYTWAMVNTGLYYLFLGLKADRYAEIDLTTSDVDHTVALLAHNAQAALGSFRICHEPSLEACQALTLLGTFCMKSGQIDEAWKLFSAAAHACFDLGFHALPTDATDINQSRSRKVFWYVFLMEKGLALTIGRPQMMHYYDISTDTSSHPNEVLGIPAKVAVAFFELAIIEGEMMPQLFSASSRHLDPDIRKQKGHVFHSRLKQIRLSLAMSDSSPESPFNESSILVNVLVASAKTLVCWSTARRAEDVSLSYSQHACPDCLGDARWVLQTLIATAESKRPGSKGWSMLLSMTLCLAPFTPYLVLALNALAEKNAQDLTLLERMNSILSLSSADSPIIRRTLETCKRLHKHVVSSPDLLQTHDTCNLDDANASNGANLLQESLNISDSLIPVSTLASNGDSLWSV